jgi:predicted alpha/beta-fold hydrolase
MTWAAPIFVHHDAPRSIVDAACALRKHPFTPARTAGGAHRQTLLGATHGRSAMALSRLTIPIDETGGVVNVFHPTTHPHTDGAPLVVLVHGLGGGVDSPYMTRLAQKALARGLVPALVELYPERVVGRPPIFHAGNDALLVHVIEQVVHCMGAREARIIAVSLGGNLVLRALVDERSRSWLTSAVVISPLVDLIGTYRALERPEARVYRKTFLRALVARVRREEALYRGHVDLDRVYASRTVRDFDAAFAAPLGGYVDVWDYYRRASALPHMAHITTPTLILHAADDPLIPVEGLLREEAHRSPHVLIGVTAHGGHAGFVGKKSAVDADRRWAENRAIDFVTTTNARVSDAAGASAEVARPRLHSRVGAPIAFSERT